MMYYKFYLLYRKNKKYLILYSATYYKIHCILFEALIKKIDFHIY